MGTKRAVGVAAAVVGLTALSGALPAAADFMHADEGEGDISFLLDGEELTCTVYGQTSTTFQDSNDTQRITSDVSVRGDAGCAEAVVGVNLQGSFEPSPGSGNPHGFVAVASGPFVTTSFVVAGPTGSIRVAHFANFACDAGQCTAAATTSPK
jgi:hypothetical protein